MRAKLTLACNIDKCVQNWHEGMIKIKCPRNLNQPYFIDDLLLKFWKSWNLDFQILLTFSRLFRFSDFEFFPPNISIFFRFSDFSENYIFVRFWDFFSIFLLIFGDFSFFQDFSYCFQHFEIFQIFWYFEILDFRLK